MAYYRIVRWLDITRMEVSERCTLPAATRVAWDYAYRCLAAEGALASIKAREAWHALGEDGPVERLLRDPTEDYADCQLVGGYSVTITRVD